MLQFPLEGKTLKNCSQYFGMSRFIYYPKYGKPGHNGLDWPVIEGTPVHVCEDGIIHSITLDSPDKTKGNGIYVYHPSLGLYSNYWHLKSFADIRAGQNVKAGDVIGYSGNTGFSTGPHLHHAFYKAFLNNEYDGFIDPSPFYYALAQAHNDGFNLELHGTLYPGSRGDYVSMLQTFLKLEFPEINWQPIGIYGPKTFSYVRKFQARNGLVADGIVGRRTIAKLTEKYYVDKYVA